MEENLFSSKAHEDFYCENIVKCRCNDCEHKALFYCLGINEACRNHISKLYDFAEGCVKPDALHQGWQTGSSRRCCLLAFHLYNGGVPSAFELEGEKRADEIENSLICNIFGYSDDQYYLNAIRVRFSIA